MSWRSVVPVVNAAIAAAAGIAKTARAPRTAARRPPLLLDIRPAVGGRRDGAPDDARDGDQREDVRQCLEEGRGGAGVDRQPVGERGREAEEEGGAPGSERAPVAEDHRGERDEPATLGHVLGEAPVEKKERQERATECREDARG